MTPPGPTHVLALGIEDSSDLHSKVEPAIPSPGNFSNNSERLELFDASSCGVLRNAQRLFHFRKMCIRDRNPNCGYAWMDYTSSPKVNGAIAMNFGMAPANGAFCDMSDEAKAHCDYYNATDEEYFKNVWFWTTPVSYTHLDVYKRQLILRPKVLLLDEPLGALDKQLREQMQIELKQIQREVGITFIFVTYDQEEALTLSAVSYTHLDVYKRQVSSTRKRQSRIAGSSF